MKTFLFSLLLLVLTSEMNAKIKPDGCFIFGIMTAKASTYPTFNLNGGVKIPITDMLSVATGIGANLFMYATKETFETTLRTGKNYYAYGSIELSKKVIKPLLYAQIGAGNFNGKDGKKDYSYSSPYLGIGTGFNLMSNKRHAGMAVRLQYYTNTSVPKCGVLFGVGFCF